MGTYICAYGYVLSSLSFTSLLSPKIYGGCYTESELANASLPTHFHTQWNQASDD